MIAWLIGKVLERNEDRVIVRNGDSGYEVIVGPWFQPKPGDPNVELWIWHVIREDSQRLYGFRSNAEREIALQVAETDGVGPVIAHRFVTGAGVDAIEKAVLKGDAAGIPKVKGLGAGKVTDIVATLRKNGRVAEIGDPRCVAALAALRVMGHQRDDMPQLVAEAARANKEASPQQLVKIVLPKLPPL